MTNTTFERLDFEDAVVEKFDIDRVEKRITVVIRNVGLFPETTVRSSEDVKWLSKATLVFDDVVKSNRTVHKYIKATLDLESGPPSMFDDGAFAATSSETKVFTLQCLQNEPHAWLDWTIEANRFHIIC